ncbi:MAG: hypothetical protein ACR2HG_03780 [Pyrinomonadaceae bacterium]
MTELDEIWARQLSEARIKAQAQGRGDVAEYLALKESNDAVRQASVAWLFESLTEIVSFANRSGTGIAIETENSHRFAFGNANLLGSRLDLRQGVRCLILEAGWTRTPADGFMRGGALAIARLSHFGLSKHNADLILISEKNLPSWFSIDADGKRSRFDSRNLQQHFQIFLGTV